MKKYKLVLIFILLFVVTAGLFFMTGCGEKITESLYKPTNISYDGFRISWDKVTLAEYYNVQINGGEKKRVNTNIYSYDAKGKEFDATIYAVYGSVESEETIHFTPLNTITDITVADNGELFWSEVSGATAYRISVNGKVLDTDLIEAHYMPEVGGNRIKVRPVVSGDNSYFSVWSEEKQVYINSAPTKISYDGEVLSWIGNSASYEVSINGQKQIVHGSSLIYDSDNQDFKVEVKSLGDHASSFDSKVLEETFHYLQPVIGISLEDGILTWEEINNAVGYEIKINGVIQNEKVKDPSFDKLTSGTSLDVAIRPYNDTGNYFSSWSITKNVYILETPTVFWNADLELDGAANNNFIWNTVSGAVGYLVEIEKDGFKTQTTYSSVQMAFAHAYREVGTYKVRVKALADETSDISDSKFSKEIVVERLAAPKASTNNFIISDATSLAKGFTVNFTAVSGATSYQLYKDGVLLEGKNSNILSISDTNVADDTLSEEQEYNYYIRSMGGVKVTNSTTYVTLPCLTENALSFKIVVQAMPTNLTMSGFNASWSAVNGNNGYSIMYSGKTINSSETSYNLSTLKAGNYDVSVCTKGNGGSVLASNYTAPITINRLNAPTGIKISYGTGEGRLLFNNVANAKSYQVFLDQSEQALPENAYDNMYQFIRESGTVLNMVSVANYFNDLRTIYYMTSEASPTQQFIRLAAPTYPEGVFANNTEILWNASANINTSEYTPTYEVYESNVMQTGGVQNGTKFNIEYLEGGKSYTFRIKAKGNDSKYLDSELSIAITVYKLATPTLYIENNMYCWNGVTNASSYVLEIDGERVNNEVHVSGNQYSYIPRYTQIGTHIVKLYAIGDGYNNIRSDAFEYNQIVKACSTPEIEYSYSNNQFINGGRINVNVTTESANCSGYLYEIAGESISSKNLSESKVIESAGTYTIRVKAIGGNFDIEEVYYIDSQYSGGGTGYSMILLAAPTLASFSLNSDGAVKWATITNALGYDYEIAFNGGEYSSISHSGTASLNPIENFKNYKTISIRVRSTGNGTNIISSIWVTYTWTNPNK